MTDRESEIQIIRIYNQILDKPYDCDKTQVRPSTLSEMLSDIKTRNRGSCSTKHYLMGSLIGILGRDIEYLSYTFLWSDLKIDWPQSIRHKVHELPPQWHLALRLKAGHLLDATWDPGISGLGFPVNPHLEELCHTRLAVLPLDDGIVHSSAEDRLEYFRAKKNTTPNRDQVYDFYNQLNSWLVSVRG